MKVLILTTVKTVYEGEAVTLMVPGLLFKFQILEHHASIIAFLAEGKINLQSIDQYFVFYIKNGLLKVKDKIVKILIY